MRNAIGYIRVSTEEQVGDDKYGVETQKQAILKYAKDNDYKIKEWFVDKIGRCSDYRQCNFLAVHSWFNNIFL